MTDAFGTKIREGDLVLYAKAVGDNKVEFQRRVVLKVEPSKVHFELDSERWTYNKKTDEIDKKVVKRKSYVVDGDRLFVLKRASDR